MSHQYSVTATTQPEGLVALNADGLPEMESGPPKEFGGSGTQWSPEDLLVGAVADCFVQRQCHDGSNRLVRRSWLRLAFTETN